MNAVSIAVALAYLLAAAGFVVALHLMNSPATARRGSRLSWMGMIVAVAAVLTSVIHEGTITTTGWIVLSTGAAGGAVAGLVMARRVKMTDVPQVVSIFNAVGGGAAALVAAGDFVRLAGEAGISTRVMIATVLDMIIGPVTFSGSLIAAGKLQGWVSSRPVVFRGARLVTAALAVIGIGASCYLLAGHDSIPVLVLVTCAGLGFGVTMTMPIGGADMPVVIALLNSFTGIAVAIAGFVIDNGGLIIGGALVGASGGILTVLMAQAMNRSVLGIMMGGFGTGDGGPAGGPAGGPDVSIRSISAEDAAIQLAYAGKVVIVPGYGLAAAQAQHEAAELAAVLAEHATVFFAIHPGSGPDARTHERAARRANVPYEDLKEMDAANPEFPTADVALVVGANDVTNPAARRPGNPVSGMPILDVDKARSIIVIKRSMGHGYAGID
ncbi:MAG TPA: NAD(P)(+) transhydrogenase (Re/Si-specific) subunit beta, partial [Streptosporangiaceae bacterium]|nr:NAD(P)(+) transhydrogenase (Re/Si-specific) subunit beta [Streptosporangiaceae bacterium]